MGVSIYGSKYYGSKYIWYQVYMGVSIYDIKYIWE